MADVRRVERAAEEARSAPLEHLVAELDLVARARTRAFRIASSSSPAGGRAGDAEAALGAEDAIGAPRRLRPVDEVVDELCSSPGAVGTISSGGTSSNSARFSSSMPAPVAAETRNTRTMRSSSIANAAAPG